MEITRNTLDTYPGPAEWFTGPVYVDTIAAPSPDSRIGAAAPVSTTRSGCFETGLPVHPDLDSLTSVGD